jgi:hypothetical protein
VVQAEALVTCVILVAAAAIVGLMAGFVIGAEWGGRDG